MALCHEVTQQFCWIIWIFTLLLTESASKKSQTLYMDNFDCDNTFLLGGATVYSHHGLHSSQVYGAGIDCRITFQSENASWKLMLHIEDLDIPDTSYDNHLCNDALYIYDAKTIFGQAFDEAGGTAGLCRSVLPSVIYSSGPYLTIYFRTDKGGLAGRGFKLVITSFSDDLDGENGCGDDFHCKSHVCINRELVCDGVSHCDDMSDESSAEPAKCGVDDSFIGKIISLGITAAIAITVGTIVVIVVIVVCIVCCCCRCNKKRQQDPAATTTTTTATSVTINNGAPPIINHPSYNPVYNQQGYYPMQPVPQGTLPHVSNIPPTVPMSYSPFPHRDSNSYSQGSGYSSHAPPSYHRSYTPTSSKSGRSHQSSDNMVIKYNTHNQERDKVIMPVHV